MKAYRVSQGILGVALSFTAVMTLTSTSQASPSAATDLKLPGYGDLLIDDTGRRVFISGGESSNGIVVTDLDGNVTSRIENLPGASDIEMSDDGKRLYVALAAGDAIAAIDTTTLTEITRYKVKAQSCPTHMARTGKSVWFSYGCESDWFGKIGLLDTSEIVPSVKLDLQKDLEVSGPPLLTAATEKGQLVAGQATLSRSMIQVYNVTAGKTLTKGEAGAVAGSGLSDLALNSTGTELFTASASRPHAEAFNSTDLARTGVYATPAGPNSITVDKNGKYVAAGTATRKGSEVRFYKTGAITPFAIEELPAGNQLLPRGIAWSQDCGCLATIARDIANDRINLRITKITTPVETS